MAANRDKSLTVGTYTHGTELEKAEITVAAAYSRLTIEYGAAGIGLYPYCKN